MRWQREPLLCARSLTVNKHPNKPLAPLDREFIKLVLSKQGQQVVVKDGYIPLPARIEIEVLTPIAPSELDANSDEAIDAEVQTRLQAAIDRLARGRIPVIG